MGPRIGGWGWYWRVLRTPETRHPFAWANYMCLKTSTEIADTDLSNMARNLHNLVPRLRALPPDFSGPLSVPALQGLGDKAEEHSPRRRKGHVALLCSSQVGISYEPAFPQGLHPGTGPWGHPPRDSPPHHLFHRPQRPTLRPGPEKLVLGAEDSPITVSWKCLLASPASLTATQE